MSFIKTLATLAVGFAAAKGVEKFRGAGGLQGMHGSVDGAIAFTAEDACLPIDCHHQADTLRCAMFEEMVFAVFDGLFPIQVSCRKKLPDVF